MDNYNKKFVFIFLFNILILFYHNFISLLGCAKIPLFAIKISKFVIHLRMQQDIVIISNNG
jgi:hypothetical protein